jgi:hypothetical protein
MGGGGIAPPSLTSAPDGGKWSASRPCLFISRGKSPGPGIRWIGGWVGPRVGLDAVEKRKIKHWRESNLGRPACSPLLYWLSYSDFFLTLYKHKTQMNPINPVVSPNPIYSHYHYKWQYFESLTGFIYITWIIKRKVSVRRPATV